MPDPIDGAPAPRPSEGPAAPQSAPAGLSGTAPTPAADPPAEVTAPAEQRPSLSELVRASREDRERATLREREATDWKTRYEEAEGRLARVSKADLLADPLGFAELHGLTPQEMAVIGETYLYNLVPDRAPADFRVRLLEAQTARKERLRDAQDAEARERAARERAQETERAYVAGIQDFVTTAPAGTHPDSEAWFGGDHEAYTQSLFATAINMAEAAAAVGKRADLSFANVARVLEQDLATRYDRRAPKRAPAESDPRQGDQTQQKPAPVAERAATTAAGATSTSALGGNGTPRPPAMSEAERVKRAIEAAFTSR